MGEEAGFFAHVVGQQKLAAAGYPTNDPLFSDFELMALFDHDLSCSTGACPENRPLIIGIVQKHLDVVVAKALLNELHHLGK